MGIETVMNASSKGGCTTSMKEECRSGGRAPVDQMLTVVVSVTINREMRNLIQSLQNHNQQLKMESARYKRRLKETQVEMGKVSWCLFVNVAL